MTTRTPSYHTGSGLAPKVSVLMLTYNHERYIAQAIESVFEQKTDFEIELLIGDDCSNDGTAEIVRRFQKQFSNISLFSAKKNRGLYQNLAQIFYRARGKYIAFLEGDDFWITPGKLQKQVDYLEDNPSVVLCFHRVRLFENGVFNGKVFPESTKARLMVSDLLEENLIPTGSVVFRRQDLPLIPFWCEELRMLDWPLFLLLAARGEVAFLPEELAAYRLHSAGVWSTLEPQHKSEQMIQVLQTIKQYFPSTYANRINRSISELYRHISWCCEQRNALPDALLASWRATAVASFPRIHPASSCLRLALKTGLYGRGHAYSSIQK